jgi:diguanylate cyclase (GGDEF)-like protein
MLSEREREIVEEVSKLLLDIMMHATPPPVHDSFASIDSFQTLYADLLSLRDLLYATSNGDLSGQVPFEGYIGSALKTLQANLRHITWQTKRVASGDFTQRIEFMGEFSQSFNAMVRQLDQTLKELARKETRLSKANEELLKEINIRKHTEATLRDNEEALRLMAITDSLTDLYNRRYFYELAEAEISKALRYSRPLSIMMFDIDFFKHINNNFGHAIGDMALKMVAKTTKEMLRATDIPARYGGEEFVALLAETPVAQAAIVAERLRRLIGETTVQAGEYRLTVTVSFGVSGYVGKMHSRSKERVLSELVTNADKALYASKNAGRNRVTVYEPEEESFEL